MMWSALAASLWAVGGTIVAVSGTRYHYNFARFLFIPSALIIIPWLGYDFGLWAAIAALLGAGSMLRWPIYYLSKFLIAKAMGRDFEWPNWKPKNK